MLNNDAIRPDDTEEFDLLDALGTTEGGIVLVTNGMVHYVPDATYSGDYPYLETFQYLVQDDSMMIIPGFVTCVSDPFMSFGVMGADMQAQGHVQMMVRTADFMQNPQAAADAPRWKVSPDNKLLVEASFGEALIKELADRGHDVEVVPHGTHSVGAAQLIRRLDYGYAAASEPRRDGQAVGF